MRYSRGLFVAVKTDPASISQIFFTDKNIIIRIFTPMTYQFIIKKAALLLLCLFIAHAANAADYTAVASGNYTSSSTWLNGNTPPVNSSMNKITIPASITVTANHDLRFYSSNNTHVLHIDGKLEMPSNILSLVGAYVSGSGVIEADSIHSDGSIGTLGSNFNFNGTINVNSINATHIVGGNSTGTINVRDILHLNDTMTWENGTIHLAANCLVMLKSTSFSGPALRADTLTSAGDIDIIYTGNWVHTGAELLASGLRNVTLLMNSSTSQVIVHNDIIIKGKLHLDTGILNMGTHDLTLATTAGFEATKDRGMLRCFGGDFTINTSTQLTSPIQFAYSSNTVGSFTINTGNTVGMRGSLKATTNLHLIKGKLEVVHGSLWIPPTPSPTGYDKDRYIITTNGPVATDMTANYTFFSPIGTATEYLPYKITTQNTPFPGIETYVRAGVADSGLWGVPWAATKPVVNATWVLYNITNGDVDIELIWFPSAEVNGFDRNNAYISSFAQQWDTQPRTSATANADGSYSITRKNLRGQNVYAVFDKNTVGINDVMQQQGIKVYPNPATNILHIDAQDAAHLYIYNIYGQQVYVAAITHGVNNINTASLPYGMYMLKLAGAGGIATHSFIKQ